ncbi:hypothetical protein TNCV_1856011 [Trichonephila clavipes]|nr:hypothetical protein TNCV_1856011 [Trichonephila clavipes]
MLCGEKGMLHGATFDMTLANGKTTVESYIGLSNLVKGNTYCICNPVLQEILCKYLHSKTQGSSMFE